VCLLLGMCVAIASVPAVAKVRVLDCASCVDE
jgi:hypothetical protein